MNNEEDKKQIRTLLYSVVIIFTTVLALIALNYTTDIFKTPRQIEKREIIEKPIIHEPEPKPSEYPDYNNLTNLNSLIILENTTSWSPEGKIEKIIGYSRELKSTGKFSRIYLYAEVSINDKPFTQYESLYVKFNYVGGHLFRLQSLKIPPNTITRLLYAVNNVPYLTTIPYSENKTPLTVNWFKFFKDGSLITFNVFISSLKPAMINKIVLYYDCTEGSDCKIEILK